MMRDSVVDQSLHQDLKPFSKGRHKGGCQEAATSLRSSSSCPCFDFGDGQTRQNRFIKLKQLKSANVPIPDSHVPVFSHSDFQIIMMYPAVSLRLTTVGMS